MDTQIILVYCLCDDLLKAMMHRQKLGVAMAKVPFAKQRCLVACFGKLSGNRGFMRPQTTLLMLVCQKHQGRQQLVLGPNRVSSRQQAVSRWSADG